VHGENILGRKGELTLDRVIEATAKVFEVPWTTPEVLKVPIEPPPRPPILCAGCPHRATFYALKIATKKLRVDPIYSGDIGCYSLGIAPPYEAQDVIIEMGGSIGLANGFAHTVKNRPVAAIIGDSTFFHAGLPPLINAVYNRAPVLGTCTR
jgi:indolepyruvate ferredoxin oxidoreductase alpha subunit